MKHPSLDGLKPYHEYIEHLQDIYPNVPYETIKKVEKKYKDEREMNNELKRLSMNEHRQRIGQQIAKIRIAKGITQEGLSELTGLDRANISKIENGRCNVTIDILQKICDTLDASIEIK